MNNFEIGQEVVRTKGDYVVGRVGNIVALDEQKQRAQVAWKQNPKTWVSFKALAPTSIPYEIIPSRRDERGFIVNPKYRPL